jgi:hypothetical protein
MATKFLLVKNYSKTDEVVAVHDSKKKADAANAALRGVLCTVCQVHFESPMDHKALKEARRSLPLAPA